MKKSVAVLLILAAAALAGCGNFEWFPNDVPPNVSASIGGKTIFNNSSTHVTTLPSTVTFYSINLPATIYYTTNGTTPSSASPSVSNVSTGGTSGPSISTSGTNLQFFGVSISSQRASSIINAIIKSP